MSRLIIQNIGWSSHRANEVQKHIFPIAKKLKELLELESDIIVHLYKNHSKEDKRRAKYDEGIIILFDTSIDWRGDFLHEFSHQLLRQENMSLGTKVRLNKLKTKLDRNKGDGRIFIQEHTRSNIREIWATIFKWWALGEIVEKGYQDVLYKFVPEAKEIIEKVISNDKLIKSSEEKIKKEIIGKIKGLNIVLVNGKEVKENKDIDFAEGGNPQRYEYIPDNEIWIEQPADKHDVAGTIVHEVIEYNDMKYNKSEYDEAHEYANGFEKKFRSRIKKEKIKTNNDAFKLAKECIDRIFKEEKIIKSSQYKIYVDLDGVLCDFDSEMKTWLGDSAENIKKNEGEQELFNKMNALPEEFWSDMEWLKDGRKLWKGLKAYNPKVLTSPTRSETCVTGKIKWVNKNLKLFNEDIIIDSAKEKYASPDSILIDDREQNIEKWEKFGGVGILYKDYGSAIEKLVGYVEQCPLNVNNLPKVVFKLSKENEITKAILKYYIKTKSGKSAYVERNDPRTKSIKKIKPIREISESQKTKRDNFVQQLIERIEKIKTKGDYDKLIEDGSKHFGSKERFINSKEYKNVSSRLNRVDQAISSKKDDSKKENRYKKIMEDVGHSFGDRVQISQIGPYASLQKYTGVIFNDNGAPMVRLDEGQKSPTGGNILPWSRDWRKTAGEIQKSAFEGGGLAILKAKGLPVGTVKNWKSGKYQKVSNVKWQRLSAAGETAGRRTLKAPVGLTESEKDLAEELLDNGAEIDADGLVTLYHRTSEDNKKKIEETSRIHGKEDGIFFSTSKEGQAEGYGKALVKVKVHLRELELDDVFGEEAHVRIPTKKAGEYVDVHVIGEKKEESKKEVNIPVKGLNKDIDFKANEKFLNDEIKDVKIFSDLLYGSTFEVSQSIYEMVRKKYDVEKRDVSKFPEWEAFIEELRDKGIYEKVRDAAASERLKETESFVQNLTPVHSLDISKFLRVLKSGGLKALSELEGGGRQSGYAAIESKIRPDYGDEISKALYKAIDGYKTGYDPHEYWIKNVKPENHEVLLRNIKSDEDYDRLKRIFIGALLDINNEKKGAIGYEVDKEIGTNRHVFSILGPNGNGSGYGEVSIVLKQEVMRHPDFNMTPCAGTSFVSGNAYEARKWAGKSKPAVGDVLLADQGRDRIVVTRVLPQGGVEGENSKGKKVTLEGEKVFNHVNFHKSKLNAAANQSYYSYMARDIAAQGSVEEYLDRQSHGKWEGHLPAFVPTSAFQEVIMGEPYTHIIAEALNKDLKDKRDDAQKKKNLKLVVKYNDELEGKRLELIKRYNITMKKDNEIIPYMNRAFKDGKWKSKQ